MTTTITERDKKLLYVCGIVLFLFVFVQYLLLPGLSAMQQAESDLQQADEARAQMQLDIAMAPAAARQVQTAQDELRAAARDFYPLLKSDALDTLVTGIELNHSLLPLSLTISQPTPLEGAAGGVPVAGVSANGILASLAPEEWNSADDGDFLQAAAVNFRAQGSRADFAALLDDLAANYPAIQLRSFSIQDSASVDPQGNPTEVSTFDVSLTIYLCDKERELA